MRSFFSRPPEDLRRDGTEKCAHRVNGIANLKHPVNRGIVRPGGPARGSMRLGAAGRRSAVLGVKAGANWRREAEGFGELTVRRRVAPITGRRPLRRHGRRPSPSRIPVLISLVRY
jgi:hypothetical protein